MCHLRKILRKYIYSYTDYIYVPIKSDELTSSKKAVYIIIDGNTCGIKYVFKYIILFSKVYTLYSIYSNIKIDVLTCKN